MRAVFELILKVWEDNPPWEWALAGTTACLVLAISIIIRRWIRRRYRELAQTPERELAEVPLEIASKTSNAFLIVASLFPGFYTLELPSKLRHGVTVVFTVIGFWQLGVWSSEAVRAWFLTRRRLGVEPGTTSGMAVLAFVGRIGVWAVIALLMLDNLGVDVTTLVAGLGVGGIAIALAVQNVLGDLFASLSITLDRPFVVGDLIVLGEYSGTVEQIGVKSTRLRSVNGEQIIFSNADLLRAQLRNFGRMDQRRVLFTLNVSYETPRDKLKRIPALIRAQIESVEATRCDRSHFSRFGPYALEFETAYWVLSSDYARYMDVQQSVYLAIHEAFEREDIEFAYPTQKLWLAGLPEGKPG
jgi:small-conductance mechanosensitive channel